MKRKAKRHVHIFFVVGASLVVIITALYLSRIYTNITALFISRGFPSPSIVYSGAFYLKEGIPEKILINKLRRLNYHRVNGTPSVQGNYAISGGKIYIYTKKFKMPYYTILPLQAVIYLSGDRIGKITSYNDEPMNSLELEPEQLATFFGDDFKMRVPVNLPSLPNDLINAVIVTEDVRFFEHGAMDIKGIFRAFLSDVLSMSISQGGSTITQQLVKILFLNNRRTFERKFKEAIMAIMIAHRFAKAQILNAYLNDVYLGQDRYISVVGIGAAAGYYFSKPVEKLNLSQYAMLAGLIASPNKFSPITHQEQAIKRRNYVLSRMLEYHVISVEDYKHALSAPLDIKISHITVKSAPYFTDYIFNQLKSRFSGKLLTGDGLRIFTTIDMNTQIMAKKALAAASAKLEGAMVVIQPQTGYVLAMIGGRNYRKSQFNRAVMSRRQIGSCVKPFIYMLALGSMAKEEFSQASLVDDSPLKIKIGDTEWQPRNYSNKFRGYITVRYALQHSINVATVKIALKTGLKNISGLLEQLGLASDIPAFPSIALGSTSTSPLRLALAYTIFANNCYEPLSPISIKAVTDMRDNVIYKTKLGFKPVGTAQECYIINNILLGSETEGTGRGLRRFDIQGEYAGKTGTTNDFRDVWFAGYTPDVVAVDWLGYDNETRIGKPAALVALPVIGRFLEMYTRTYGGKAFNVPSGIKFACVDKYTGISGKNITNCVDAAFLTGTEPEENVIKSIIDWFTHLLHK